MSERSDERLARAIEILDSCLYWAVDACTREAGREVEVGLQPAQMRDSNGRFLLLDAAAALVTGLAALHAAPSPTAIEIRLTDGGEDAVVTALRRAVRKVTDPEGGRT